MVAFALLPRGVSLAAILACAVVAGAALPPLGACLRTLWPALLDSPERIHAAFALDAAAIEIVYIAGPVLIAGALGSWSLAASAVACAVLLVARDARVRVLAVLAGVAAGRARARPAARCDRRACGRWPVVFVLMGLAFGADRGRRSRPRPTPPGHAGAAGLLLGAWGLGSFTGGVLAARAARASQTPSGACACSSPCSLLGHGLLAAAGRPVPARRRALRGGRGDRPGLRARLRPGRAGARAAGTVTEAYTWLSTGLAGGIAAGAAPRARSPKGRPGRGASSSRRPRAAGAALTPLLRRATIAPAAR